MNREKLLEENMKLVPHVVHNVLKIPTTEFDYEDILQEGYIGLWKRTKNFSEDSDAKFSTYACTCIRNRVINYLNKPRRTFYRGIYMGGVSLDNTLDDSIENTFHNVIGSEESDTAGYVTLKNVLDSLDKDDVMVKTLMLHMQGYSNLEICDIIGCAKPTVKIYLDQIREYIKYQLG